MPEGPRPRANKPTLEAGAEPGARRAEAIIASLRAGSPTSSEMYEAFYELDSLPAEEVRDALAAWVGPLPDLDRLDTATRVALGLPLRPLRLRTLSVTRDADVLDLGPVAEEQLRLAGKSWDDADLAPEERLDGELEGSFAGTLERRVLADVESPETPLFDVLLFLGDSGVVFAAGTAKIVALIAYGKVEMRDRRTRIALEEALAAPAEEAAAEPQPEPEPSSGVAAAAIAEDRAKKPVTKKKPTARGKAPAKKTAKKPAAKAPKKPAKKSAAKVAKVAKKSAKKTSGKKTAKKAAKKAAKKKKRK